jgi:hypothetical protein
VGHLFLGGSTSGVRIRDTYFGQSILARTNKVTYAIENGLAFANDIKVSGARFQSADYATGIIGGSQGTTGMTIKDSYGYNPKGVLGPPTVPATTVAYTNAYGVDATVHITDHRHRVSGPQQRRRVHEGRRRPHRQGREDRSGQG